MPGNPKPRYNPIAKWPPVESRVRRTTSPRSESEQVREIQSRERSESRNPSPDAAIYKPAQPESKREESYGETQMKFKILPEKTR